MKKTFLVLSVLLLTAGSAFAGMVQSFGIGSKATAQAEAVSAQADDVFAVYYNPGGLTQIESPTFTAGTMYYMAKVKTDNFNADGNRFGMRDKNLLLVNQTIKNPPYSEILSPP